jgi:hypothetical protein
MEGAVKIMSFLNCENREFIKRHSKLGITSVVFSIIVYFFTLLSFLNISEWLQEHIKVLFYFLGGVQVLLMIGAVLLSLIDISKKESKKLLPIISIFLIGMLIFLQINALMYNYKL